MCYEQVYYTCMARNMAGRKLFLLLMFLVFSKSYADFSVIYSAYLGNEVRGTLSNIPEIGFYATLGKIKFLRKNS